MDCGYALLKRAREQPAGIETAFSGFRVLLSIVPGRFVTFLLTLLGFFCRILSGLYLAVAWMFALILVIEKRRDFWSAMELSRRMVAKHWFKVFGFFLVLLLMNVAGLLVCGIGVFFTAPIALARRYSRATFLGWHDGTRTGLPRVGVWHCCDARSAGDACFHSGGIFKPVASGSQS